MRIFCDGYNLNQCNQTFRSSLPVLTVGWAKQRAAHQSRTMGSKAFSQATEKRRAVLR